MTTQTVCKEKNASDPETVLVERVEVKGRLVFLDAVRAIAALMVLIDHSLEVGSPTVGTFMEDSYRSAKGE